MINTRSELTFTPRFHNLLKTDRNQQLPTNSEENAETSGDQAEAFPKYMPTTHPLQAQKPPSDKALGQDIAEKIEKLKKFLSDREQPVGVMAHAQLQHRLKNFEQFGQNVLDGRDGDFSTQIDSLYKAGKKSLDQFCDAVLDESKLSESTRLTHVRNLADGINVCSEGAASQLAIAAQELFLATGDVAANAKLSQEKLLEQSILAFVKKEHGAADHYVHNEIHYLNGYRNYLADDFGLTERHDDFVPPELDVLTCGEHVRRQVTPGHVIHHMAETCLQEIHDKFHHLRNKELSFEELGEIHENIKGVFGIDLAQRFGAIDITAIIADGDRLTNDLSLLKHAIAKNLKAAGQLEFKANYASGQKDDPRVIKQIDDAFFVRLRVPDGGGTIYQAVGVCDLPPDSAPHGMVRVALANTYDPCELKKVSPRQVWAMLKDNPNPRAWLTQMGYPDVLRYREANPEHEISLLKLADQRFAKYSPEKRQRAFKNIEDDKLAARLAYHIDLQHVDENKNMPLHHAVRQGLSSTVSVMAQRCQFINALGADEKTALMLAAESNQVGMVESLLTMEANKDARGGQGETALSLAAEHGHAHVVEQLVKAGADIHIKNTSGSTALIMAAEKGHHEIVKILANAKDAKASIDARAGQSWTALMYGATLGHVKVVEELVKVGADTYLQNISGWTALRIAAAKGHDEIVKVLANAKGAKAGVDAQGVGGWTALMYGATLGHTKMVEELVKVEANVHIKNTSGQTALMIAAAKGHAEVAKILMNAKNAKDSIDAQDSEGQTALMQAALNDHADVIIKLREAGVKTDLTNRDGETALELARRFGRNKALEAIVRVRLPLRETLV